MCTLLLPGAHDRLGQWLQDLTFTSCAVAHFNCLVLFLSNLLLLAYFSVALAGALDQ
jgi:hypothetical protein